MNDTKLNPTAVTTPLPEGEVPEETTAEVVPTEAPPEAGKGKETSVRGRARRGGGRGRGRERGERPRSEFDQVTISVRRVARVMAGGRRFSFSVALVIGDKKGRVGVGLGKGADTAL